VHRLRLSPRQAILLGVVGIIACWILASPRYAGPDEASHSVASAALVRGDVKGQPIDLGYPSTEFLVPSMVGDPNPGCFAFQSEITADCAAGPANSTALVQRDSTSATYPIWGHLLPGIASFVPSPVAFMYLARLLNSLLAVALLVATFLRLRRTDSLWVAVGLAVGFTPIAWFALSIVSPSALAIAGGTAIWAAMLSSATGRSDALFVAGWCALLLPRRDGPLWATLVVGFACCIASVPPSVLWRRLGRTGRIIVAVSLPLPLLPTVMHGVDKLNTGLVLAPLAIPAGEWLFSRASGRLAHRGSAWTALLLAFVVALASVVAANLVRTGGPDGTLTLHVISNTGRHLRQIVGVLGWLDAPIPEVAVLVWWIVLGGLAGLALLNSPRHAIFAASMLATAVITAWVLELGTGDTTANYWQGRYSMPFVVGVPMVLGAGIRTPPAARRRIVRTVQVCTWSLWNVAFVAAMHRWGSGLSGTWLPWRWHDWHQPGPISGYLVVHALASGWLLAHSVPPDTADILDRP
jgi:hypothetical protein